MQHQVLLYYSYAEIADPEALADRQRSLCKQLQLTGRLIFATEGINGTLEGTVEQTEKYISISQNEPSFKEVVYKKSSSDGASFRKLSVKARTEIVSAHLDENDISPRTVTGTYLKPDELHQWISVGKEFYIVDMRNDYEHVVGYFEGSIMPPIRNFRQLPEVLPVIEHLRSKTILTVCTGGVRCVKASGFLLENGYADVYQLEGGIVSYMEQYPNQDFLGALYVFDGRVTMAFHSDEHSRQIVGRCEYCSLPCETYVNCYNDDCHRHFICCKVCDNRRVQKECLKCVKEFYALTENCVDREANTPS